MTFKDHFSGHSAGYARHRPTYPEALVDFLADAAPATGLAWDAGCGSGQLSVPLARRFATVVATDASAEQIKAATPHERVTYRTAPAGASGLDGPRADLAVAAQAAHWFDLDDYYAEVRRVAGPGAVVALVCYGVMTLAGDADPLVREFHDRTLAPYWPPERRHVVDNYRGLPFPFPELPAPALAITVDWDLAGLLGYVDTWSAVKAAERSHGGPAVAAFRGALATAWGNPATVRTIAWPLGIRIGRT